MCEAKAALEFDLPNAALKEAGVRGQAFVNGGHAVSATDFSMRSLTSLANWSSAAGVGIAIPALNVMRFEVNYVAPLHVRGSDRARPAGLQFGVTVGAL